MPEKNFPAEKISSGTNTSYWIDSFPPVRFSPLRQNEKADVVIVGGGIAGISIAYRLCMLNKKVIVLEDGFVGSGETGRTSAHLSNALDDHYYELERIFGKKGAELAAQSHGAAIDFIEQTIKTENIDCEFERVPGYLFLHPSDKEKTIEKEFEAAKRAGLNVELLDKTPVIKYIKGKCIRFHNQAQFHPLKYLSGLSDAVINKGGLIFTETHVSHIDDKGVRTDSGFSVEADHIVVATNSPVNDKFVMHLKQFSNRTYVIGVTVKKGSIPKALWWDTGDHELDKELPPYHYLRVVPFSDTHDLLLCGGEDHATGLARSQDSSEEARYAKLESWLKPKIPFGAVVYRWSGQIIEPMDALGYIGRNPKSPDNIYIVTGDSGNGLTNGTVAALLIPDLIMGKKNPWEEIYDPSRVKLLSSARTWIKEFVGGFIQYLKENPKHTDEVGLSSISVNSGKVIEIDGEKYGAYRGRENTFHFVSAECTHLGCILKWNNDEKSWDCPCHGSRFTTKGKILNGPAIKDLSYYTEKFPELPVQENKRQRKNLSSQKKENNEDSKTKV